MTSQNNLRFGTLFVMALTLFAAAARADEIWVAPTSQQDAGGLGVASNVFWPVTPIGAVRLAWAIPDNLQTFQSAKLVLIPQPPGGASTLNVFICPAEHADAVMGGCAGPFPQPFVSVANQLTEVDVSAIVAPRIGTAGATYLAVLAYTMPTTTTDRIVGLRFAYTPTAPSGVATLGANTFSGTQTAPAFVGNGAGLTNLPVPSGVATLGANVFSGTQTAPAFVGSGAGVSNVNATLLDGLDSTAFAAAGSAATLGANTFNGTQTIDTGNLDLDISTATTGMITKNGGRFLHDFGLQNLFLGVGAGNLTMTGTQNTVIGFQAFDNNTTGGNNTATGSQALGNNTEGGGNTATGFGALANNTMGNNNTATGPNALQNNTQGSHNTASGSQALQNNTTGINNVAVGVGAGFNATTGSNNIYLGADVFGVAGESNTMYLGLQGTQTKTVIAGVRGTAVVGGEPVVIDASGRLGSGAVAGANTIGTNEVINDSLTASDLAPDSVTASELAPNSVGTSEVAFNFAASTSEGGPATDVACAACVGPTEVSFSFADLGTNTFTGTQTINGGNLDLDAATGKITRDGVDFLHATGTDNTFLGIKAGASIGSGSRNTALGLEALRSLVSGTDNTAIGHLALAVNNSLFNTAIGAGALAVGTGNGNTAVGYQALDSTTTGANNTAVGATALSGLVTGTFNIAIGTTAGSVTSSGDRNIYIGHSGVAGAESDTIRIGASHTRAFIRGIRGAVTGNADAIPVVVDSLGQLGTVSSSRRFKEDIHDMADTSRRLLQLRPVTFRYKQASIDGAKPIQYGLIAEEVAETFPELAVRNADGQIETVHYETLNVLLLNELQRQQRELTEERKAREDEQQQHRQRIEALEQKLNELLRKPVDH